MKERDPLGIKAILRHTRESHTSKPIDKDQFTEWLANPVTKRLMQEIACELHETATSGQYVSQDKVDAVEMILNWTPQELVGESNNE